MSGLIARVVLILFTVLNIGLGSVGQFYFVIPQATTNMITCPSFEKNSTGWTAVGGSVSRVTTNQRRGSYGLQVTPTSGSGDGVYFGTVSLVSGQDYTFSIDVLGELGVPYKIYFASTAGTLQGTATTFTGTGKWERIEVSYNASSTASRRLYITKDSSSSTAVFYIDGAQCENYPYSTSYCDGSLDGCRWVLQPEASQSVRSSQTRNGGRRVDLDAYNASLVAQQGTGMPPMRNQLTPYGGIAGSFYHGSLAAERPFTLTFSQWGDGVDGWHAERQNLINIVKTDVVTTYLPMIIGYTDAGGETEIECIYDGGLEINDGKRDIDTIAMRFLAPDPYWYRVGHQGCELSQITVSSLENVVIYDPESGWSELAGDIEPLGTAGLVEVVRVSPYTGYVYIGGSFTSIDGDTNLKGIAYHDGTSWQQMDAGTLGSVADIDFAPDGVTVYVVGNFTTIGGVAANRVARWDGSNFNAMGTGAALPINVVTVGYDGNVYVGGSFASVGGVANTDGIAYWSGSVWNAMGTGVSSGVATVDAIAIGKDGNVYVGGQFSGMGGVANTSGIAAWNGSAWSALGTGITSPAVNALVVGANGLLYAFGFFTSAGGVTVENIAVWNGSAWADVGGGLNFTMEYAAASSDGAIFATGGGRPDIDQGVDSLIQWTGSVWVGTSFESPGKLNAFDIGPGDKIYATATTDTTDATTDAAYPTTTTVENDGTANGYPVVVWRGAASGSGVYMHELRNWTTKESIYFTSGLKVLPNEIITLDLRPGRKTLTSNMRGNIARYIHPGSKMASWHLAPGTNLVSQFSLDTLNVIGAGTYLGVTMYWRMRDWSLDAGVATPQ